MPDIRIGSPLLLVPFQPFREPYVSEGGRVRRALARKLAQHGLHSWRQAHIKLGGIILDARFSKNLV